MTFDEWFAGNRYLLKPSGRHRQLFTMEDLENAWNAAIEEALEIYKNLEKQQIDENDFHVYLYQDFKKLLTSS